MVLGHPPPEDPRTASLLGLSEAAQALDVSPATLRNWIRSGYVTAVRLDGRLRFDASAVSVILDRLRTGSPGRLNRRANKRRATATVLPTERLDTAAKAADVTRLVTLINNDRRPIAESLFRLALCLLADLGVTDGLLQPQAFANGPPPGLPPNIGHELAAWFYSLEPVDATPVRYGDVPRLPDLLGVCYQALRSVGATSLLGAYYTPQAIAQSAAHDTIDAVYLPQRVLDPCCGSGQFLLAAADRLEQLGCSDATERLYGWDTDPLAVRIARLNLMLRFTGQPDYEPAVVCRESLLSHFGPDAGTPVAPEHYDLILSNPPWGAAYTELQRRTLQRRFPGLTSGESFAFFLRRGLDLLEPGGRLSYVLPESVLNVQAHQDMRDHLTKYTTIRQIIPLGRAFHRIFTPVIRLDLINRAPEPGHRVLVRAPGDDDPKGDSNSVSQARFRTNPACRFDLQASDFDRGILARLYETPHVTLQGHADWGLGIVTGDNATWLSDGPQPGYEPIIEGRSIERYRLRPARRFIRFNPAQLQQVAPESRYRAAEKLIYRFISRHLVVAYDDQQRLTLNSANIVITRLENWPMKAVLLLFNSEFYQFVFQKQFAALKVLRSHLETLPLPVLSPAFLKTLVAAADRLLGDDLSPTRRQSLRVAIDASLMAELGFTDSEVRHVRAAVHQTGNRR